MKNRVPQKELTKEEAIEIVKNNKAWYKNYVGPGPDVDPQLLKKANILPLDFIDGAGDWRFLGIGPEFKGLGGAFSHDGGFYAQGASGVKSAFLSLRTTNYDVALSLHGMMGLTMFNFKKSLWNNVTNFGWSLGVATLFTPISAYKTYMRYGYYYDQLK